MLLSDLDDALLLVRDRTSRSYVEEAVVAYRAGAYRAAVVSTWIAVVYDTVTKLRELSDQGDARAAATIRDLDQAIVAQNIPALQRMENGLLDLALEPFEFITTREHLELARLRDDRHACAHPAFVREGLLFGPTPELVRVHIVHAVSHLLQHPPVQGKAALVRIKEDLLRASFPTEQDEVSRFLRHKYLDRAKPSLVETLVVVLLKVILRDSDPELAANKSSVVRALLAVDACHPTIYSATVADTLPRLVAGLNEQQLQSVFLFLSADRRGWNWIDEATKVRLRSVLDTTPVERRGQYNLTQPIEAGVQVLISGLRIDDLREKALIRFRAASSATQEHLLSQCPDLHLADDAIRIFRNASGWRHAENIGRHVILPLAARFSADEVAQCLEAVRENPQIWDAADMPAILTLLFEATQHLKTATQDSWRSFVDFLEIHGQTSRYSRLIEML